MDFPQGLYPGTTWELVDSYWKRIFVPEPVPWVTGACSAFDDARDVMVVFGTWTSNETWEYDGTTWTKRTLAVSPPARNHCGMVFDSARNKIVMFGGETSAFVPLADHWEYDGTTWVQRTFATMPSARSDPGMAFDTARGVTVMFAGRIPFAAAYNDTWEFDGTRWRKKTPATVPSPRGGAGLAYDPLRSRTVMFGGATSLASYDDTWEWNGTNWTQKFPAAAPEARRRAPMIWDASRGKTLFFGGELPGAARNNDTWTYDGTSWVQIADETIPPVRGAHGLAYDPIHDRLVLYGGYDPDKGLNNTDFLDTWFRSAGVWSEQTGVGTTSVSLDSRMTFDSSTATVRGFSGDPWQSGDLPEEVYELDGNPLAWTSTEFCCPRPDGRVYHAIADAPALGGVFIVGGRLQNGDISNECWFLSGAVWTAVASSPGERWQSALAYDIARNRLILYGGHAQDSSAIKSSDTWTYDGSAWTLLLDPSPPGEKSRHNMAYDSARDRLVLVGDGTGAENVTWEFDGTQWIAVPTPLMPNATRCESPLVYDSNREVVWMFGGRRCLGAGTYNDTWAYGEDDDGDGKVGGLDNCRPVANSDQANTDGDAAGDVCDCAPSDPTAFATPQPVTVLTLAGAGTTTLTWADQSSQIGSGARYDVARGSLNTLRSGSAAGSSCLASQLALASTSDGATPPAFDGFWYLVRSRNACGIGSYDTAIVDAAATCP